MQKPYRNRNNNNPPDSRTQQFSRPQKYTDENGCMRPQLVDQEAQDEAREWKDKVSSSQVRRFFGAAMSDLRRFELKDKTTIGDAEIRIAMASLKAKAFYAFGRDKKNLPLKNFFDHHARLVSSLETFQYFMRHFEAVVAYHKFYEAEKKGGQE